MPDPKAVTVGGLDANGSVAQLIEQQFTTPGATSANNTPTMASTTDLPPPTVPPPEAAMPPPAAPTDVVPLGGSDYVAELEEALALHKQTEELDKEEIGELNTKVGELDAKVGELKAALKEAEGDAAEAEAEADAVGPPHTRHAHPHSSAPSSATHPR
jgi:hypothetical protein